MKKKTDTKFCNHKKIVIHVHANFFKNVNDTFAQELLTVVLLKGGKFEI